MPHEPTWLDLYDYRRRVGAMYRRREAALRAGEDPLTVLQRFRVQKDGLYRLHPLSPLSRAERRDFICLSYFPYNAAMRLEATMEPLDEMTEDEASFALPASGPHNMLFRRAARVTFTIDDRPLELTVYWIDVYGGGLFLPFLDATSGGQSYAGGRYLFDTVKGTDFVCADQKANLGQAWGYGGGRIILDFNYAYNPSCAYDHRWICPLSPQENRLPIAIRAGEMKYER